ncbi:MAG: Hpt domain-containing protein [Verrucomicrobia bacterium]|nr:Hpt domain-containing protein [Verrucomicrobiota bacterium]
MDAAQTTYNDTALLDLEQLNMLTSALGEEAREVVSELIELFAEDAPELISKIRLQYADNSKQEAARAAHALAGCAANLGALKLKVASKQLENHIDELSAEAAMHIIEDLETLHLDSLAALKDYLAGLP